MPLQATSPAHDHWRQTHLGRLMGDALRRFDARVNHYEVREIRSA